MHPRPYEKIENKSKKQISTPICYYIILLKKQMFFNTTPFFATCLCDKLQFLNNKQQENWENEYCYSCNNKLVVYKDGKVVCNFNKGKFFATCSCTKIKIIKHKIIEKWYLTICNKCNSKLQVYNDENIEIQKTGIRKSLNGSCKCGHLSYYSNSINLKWENQTCELCNSNNKK